MKYFGTNDINKIPLNWDMLIGVINNATAIFSRGEFTQPIKPYLRFNNLENRIIAMPAHIGENIGVAGIKWIASFPSNIEKKLKRAHSTIILNEENTGVPFAILNTPLISGIRTASVTGSVIQKYITLKQDKLDLPLVVGLIGLGPIGQLHLNMIENIIGHSVNKYIIYDQLPVTLDEQNIDFSDKVFFVNSWEEVFDESDILCTCTVSKSAYINKKPKLGSLHLNISLRDYMPIFANYVDKMIVDDWDEVCREKTDIEIMYQEKIIKKEDTNNIAEFLFNESTIEKDDVIMFNPMGLAIYDLAIAKYYFDAALELNIGIDLPD